MFRFDRETVVKLYPYRTARVTDVFLRLPETAVAQLEATLAQQVGEQPNNHTVYEVSQPGISGKPVYIGFSDRTVTFGHSRDEERC